MSTIVPNASATNDNRNDAQKSTYFSRETLARPDRAPTLLQK